VSYCTQDDVELRYGENNIALWGNVDNLTGASATAAIAARVTAGIAAVDDDFDDVFRLCNYRVPLATEAAAVPASVGDKAAWAVGVWLYESRGAQDTDSNGNAMHRLVWIKKNILRWLEEVRTGKRKLNAV